MRRRTITVGTAAWAVWSAVAAAQTAGPVPPAITPYPEARTPFASLDLLEQRSGGSTLVPLRDLDLRDRPVLVLPTSESAPGANDAMKYVFRQDLWRDEAHPTRSFGVFGELTVTPGSTAPGQMAMNVGVTGSSPIASRPKDRFGVAYFRFRPSQDLKGGMVENLDLGEERGAEVFYTFALRRRLDLSATAQVVDPGPQASSTGVFLGLRLKSGF